MIYILSAPVQTGKSTILESWSAEKSNVGGFISPRRSGIRVLLNAKTREEIPFEVIDHASTLKTTEVGRFIFYDSSFDKASIWAGLHADTPGIEYIIIDEVGKLELKDIGFHKLVNQLTGHDAPLDKDLILVVRDTLLDKVIEKYRLQKFIHINHVDLSNL